MVCVFVCQRVIELNVDTLNTVGFDLLKLLLSDLLLKGTQRQVYGDLTSKLFKPSGFCLRIKSNKATR